MRGGGEPVSYRSAETAKLLCISLSGSSIHGAADTAKLMKSKS